MYYTNDGRLASEKDCADCLIMYDLPTRYSIQGESSLNTGSHAHEPIGRETVNKDVEKPEQRSRNIG